MPARELSQEVKDALADAETLTAYVNLRARIEADAHQYTFGHPMPENDRAADLREARVSLVPEHYGMSYSVDANGKRATAGAHKALRAVPALREE